MFTKECRPVKLFAKHLKVEEQVCIFSAMEIGKFMSRTISALHVKSIRALSRVAVNIL
jgi:hypothetical protein